MQISNAVAKLLQAEPAVEAGVNEPNSAIVVLLGIGTVFVGLVLLIAICYLMSAVVRAIEKPKASQAAPAAAPKAAPAAAPAAPAAQSIIPGDRGAFMAAVSAAIAEDMGKDVNAIRILSVKKLGGTWVQPAPAVSADVMTAITAALAEEMGKDPAAIRILSVKKI